MIGTYRPVRPQVAALYIIQMPSKTQQEHYSHTEIVKSVIEFALYLRMGICGRL